MLRPLFELGGPLMWPLLACSVALVAILFERAWTVGVRGFLLGTATPAVLAAHKRTMTFFIEIPPALGLLGTVLGVIECFRLLDGSPGTEGLGAGLGIACITTVAGLVIALVASVGQFALDLAEGHLLARHASKGGAA